MNIYFACSITGGRELEPTYQQIVAGLMADGHEIPTSHLARADAMENERGLSPIHVYERDVDWIRNCDVLLAEVSVPSHGVGYEIGFALNLGKPVLCLYQNGRKVSKMITGNRDANITIYEYSNMGDALEHIREFLSKK